MSKNAMRFAGGLNYVASTGGYDWETSKAVYLTLAEVRRERLVEELNAFFDAEAIGDAAEEINYARKGYAVAWINGREVRRAMPPVIYERKNNTRQAGRGRCVVVQVNSKLSMLHLL